MSKEENQITEKPILAKKLKNRRKGLPDPVSSDEEIVHTSENLQEIKMRQKFRERSNGLNALTLISGKISSIKKETEENNDQIKNNKHGGLINMKALKFGKQVEINDSFDVGIGSRFSVETNKCDEDEEMMKYIELELKKIKNRHKNIELENKEQLEQRKHDPTIDILHRYITPEEAALMSLPDHLKESFSQRSEEMLSNQMLNGIPEVDLGINVKIRNIEETEEAKHKLFNERKYKRDMPSQFVPNNMAVNFVQHNRYNIANARQKMRRQRQLNDTGTASTSKSGTLEVNMNVNKVKRATDDYYYDKFRKQFRRY